MSVPATFSAQRELGLDYVCETKCETAHSIVDWKIVEILNVKRSLTPFRPPFRPLSPYPAKTNNANPSASWQFKA